MTMAAIIPQCAGSPCDTLPNFCDLPNGPQDRRKRPADGAGTVTARRCWPCDAWEAPKAQPGPYQGHRPTRGLNIMKDTVKGCRHNDTSAATVSATGPGRN